MQCGWQFPTGFEYGYGGSGPAQLALALLADATGHDCLAVALHQEFKWEFVSRFPREGFTITADEVRRWAEEAAKRLDRADRMELPTRESSAS